LDAIPAIGDSDLMIAQPYHLYVERTDVAKNMARYYAMSIEPNLFGDVCLLRKWGRVGAKGQMMVHHFGREEEAVELFLDLLRQKRKRGYRPRASVASWERPAEAGQEGASSTPVPVGFEGHFDLKEEGDLDHELQAELTLAEEVADHLAESTEPTAGGGEELSELLHVVSPFELRSSRG